LGQQGLRLKPSPTTAFFWTESDSVHTRLSWIQSAQPNDSDPAMRRLVCVNYSKLKEENVNNGAKGSLPALLVKRPMMVWWLTSSPLFLFGSVFCSFVFVPSASLVLFVLSGFASCVFVRLPPSLVFRFCFSPSVISVFVRPRCLSSVPPVCLSLVFLFYLQKTPFSASVFFVCSFVLPLPVLYFLWLL